MFDNQDIKDLKKEIGYLKDRVFTLEQRQGVYLSIAGAKDFITPGLPSHKKVPVNEAVELILEHLKLEYKFPTNTNAKLIKQLKKTTEVTSAEPKVRKKS